MPGLLPDVDPDGLIEYSVVYTDRALNHMARRFHGVMQDISAVLKEVYGARSAIVVPGSGSYGMEAVARQFGGGKRALIVRNGWFSYRWTQIFEMSGVAAGIEVLKARRTGDGTAARQKIGDFARLMRSILHNSRQKSISLKEEADSLEQYLSVEQFCQQNNFDFSIRLPDNVDASELELPPMLLQPFVENAVVHGVSHLKYPGKIEVEFRFVPDRENTGTGADAGTNGVLECCIRDNGIGRERAALLRQERKPGHTSVAVDVTRERLEALKKDRTYSALEYLDRQAPNGDIAGTQVLVRIPAGVNF